MIDIQNATLTVLFAIGAVNVVMLFFPILDSRIKFMISFVAALIAYFIPTDLGQVLLNAIKEAITVAIVASGAYKVAQKAGGE